MLVHDHKQTVLMHAAQNGSSDVLQVLIDAKPDDVNACDDLGCTALMHAAGSRKTDAKALQVLIDAGANVHLFDQDKRTALMYAACYGSADALQVLISAKADVNARAASKNSWTAIMHAAARGNVDALQVLVGVARVQDINEAFLTAATLGQANALQILQMPVLMLTLVILMGKQSLCTQQLAGTWSTPSTHKGRRCYCCY